MSNDKFVTQVYYSAGKSTTSESNRCDNKESRLQKQGGWNTTQILNNIQIYGMDLLLFHVRERQAELTDVKNSTMK